MKRRRRNLSKVKPMNPQRRGGIWKSSWIFGCLVFLFAAFHGCSKTLKELTALFSLFVDVENFVASDFPDFGGPLYIEAA
ncbi:hypothetical protein Csa_013321 [Cucumis sativus]|uniref:Uncharacterized protein n=1 Tax=Cucumis sativus TaxID=3659 RepID=A0A0A0LT39_CUCSA|nr:hypothetical protein Csa_013321 [Cucumis sativus]